MLLIWVTGAIVIISLFVLMCIGVLYVWFSVGGTVYLRRIKGKNKNEITLGCFSLQTTKGYFCADLNSSFISLYPHFLLNASIFLKSFY